MSTFEIKIVPVILETHPNADLLAIVHVDAYQVVVRTKDWIGIDHGIYIPPDSLVPNKEPFKFLFKPEDPEDAKYRIRVKKLRGCISQGLLIQTPFRMESLDIAELYGITHYEAPMELNTSGETARPPELYIPVYDIENWYNYPDVFMPMEAIVITEKIHGCQGRWVFHKGEFYCGSKREWKKETDNNIWRIALKQESSLQEFLQKFPDTIAYGEVYGDVQDLKYGFSKGKVGIRLFDIFNYNRNCTFLDAIEFEDFMKEYVLPYVPILKHTYYCADNLIAEGNSVLADHLREGIVIKPIIERTHPKIGRVILKKVSNDYLERVK